MAPLWDGSVRTVAQALVGCRLVSDRPPGRTSITITEAEAYGGTNDPASHAFRSKTTRNSPMFARAGTIYVYRSYGLHWCLNIVTGPEDDPQAVLIRSGLPEEGHDLMIERRGREDHLTDGPGKLTTALGIDRSADGWHLDDIGWLSIVGGQMPVEYAWKPRVGLTKAADRPWRCVLVRD